MAIFFRDYLTECLKDEAFRKEFEAVERNEAAKAVRKRKSWGKHTSTKSTTSLPHRFSHVAAQKQEAV